MTIDKSGEWGTGTSHVDLAEYLREYEAGGYSVAESLEVTCADCGGSTFRLHADGEEGFVERTCASCGSAHLMLDSADYQEDAEPEAVVCPCGYDLYEVAVGLALRPEGDIKWVSVGIRCTRDGVLASCADWKIDYSPTEHLRAAA